MIIFLRNMFPKWQTPLMPRSRPPLRPASLRVLKPRRKESTARELLMESIRSVLIGEQDVGNPTAVVQRHVKA